MNVIEANGAKIPAIGLGTMTLKDTVCVEAVKAALRLGYRHIDTAERYGNETEVGEGLHQGLRAAGLAREDVFVTTKVYQDKLAAADFERSFDDSLKKLKLPWVDLLLIHWPNPQVPMAESIGALNKAKRDGLTRHIGVCNHTVALLDEAWAVTKEPLANNQIEVHPFLDQTKVIEATRRHGMSVTAYCPIARGRVPGNEVLERIGGTHGKTASQVSLRWLTQQGIIVIPGSGKPERQKENLDVLDFSLSPAEMNEIAGLKRPDGRVVNPPQAPKWDV
jgi:2,5-diketo-D-gluconate reductase B